MFTQIEGAFILRCVSTIRTRLMPAALALAISVPPWPACAEGGTVASDNAWIAFLKCQDLIGRTTASVNHQTFPIYSMWLRGFIAGVSSLSATSITEKVKFSEVGASVLMYCSTHQKESAVDAAVHVSSLFYSVLNANNAVVDLHSPGLPPLQE
jgi:hypothetical protein